MTFDEYEEKAHRTANKELRGVDALTTAVLGLAAEAGEVCSLIQKWQEAKQPLIADQVVSELGDVLWYIQETLHRLSPLVGRRHTLADTAIINLEKTEQRHKDRL